MIQQYRNSGNVLIVNKFIGKVINSRIQWKDLLKFVKRINDILYIYYIYYIYNIYKWQSIILLVIFVVN